jgi:DNA-binding MarR family transcriptional regulator
VSPDELDPTVAALLAELWRHAAERRGRAAALAALSKRSGVPMSSLRRSLLALEDAGLASSSIEPGGRASAGLTPQGEQLCQALFGTAPDEPGA